MEEINVLIERLKNQIVDMDSKVASLLCDIESIDDQKKNDCLRQANELQEKILETQSKIEELSKKIKDIDMPFFKTGF